MYKRQGLIIASLLGGPLAKLLIERNRLEVPGTGAEDGVLPPEADAAPIDKMGIMRAMLAINVAVILGYLVHAWLTTSVGINLPLFVPCLVMGILLSNTVPLVFPRMRWPAHTAALELISSYALSIFLAMSLMSMQLWTLAGSAGKTTNRIQAAATNACTATMTKSGPAPNAFVILPLVSAFFVDVINVGAISLFLRL